MSSLIYRQWRQYFQMPISGAVERLSLGAYRLYGLLCRTMNEQSAVVIELSNAEIVERTGIKEHRTIKKIRRELSDAGLVKTFKVPPGVYAFVMLNESGSPIPAPEGRKGVRRYSPRAQSVRPSGERAPASQPASVAPVATEKRKPDCRAIEPLPETSRCPTHGPAPHWRRKGGGLVCELCHPDPDAFGPPTAREIGF
jgi:hypothetical protein